MMIKTRFISYKSQRSSSIRDRSSNAEDSLIDIYNYTFESEKKNKNTLRKLGDGSNENIAFKLPIKKIYNVNFSVGEFTMQLNPTFNNLTYQRFNSAGFINANTDAFTLIQLKDLYEDYKITAGVKGPVQINNMGYILIFEDLKHRLDKKIQLSRQTFNNIDDNQFFFNIKKTIINDLKFQYSFPFNELTSLRLTPNLRYDQVVTLSSSDQSLAEPHQNHFLGGGLLEFVYDATRPVELNINNGFRFKTWIEGYKELDKKGD